MSKESAKPVEILTEGELNLKIRAFSTGVMPTWEFDQVINSHRNLLSANAELSFKNMKLREALTRERDDAVIWDNVTVFSRIDKLLEELK